MEKFLTRDLRLLADGVEIAQGCRMSLLSRSHLGLHPALRLLSIFQLSDASVALLSSAQHVEVYSGESLLSFGEIIDVYTRSLSGQRITSLTFSPGFSLWQASVSLSLRAGMKASDTFRALLAASGASVSLVSFGAEDVVFSRPQAFFGRAFQSLDGLAEACGGDAFLSSAGVCVVSRVPTAANAWEVIPPQDLLAPPQPAGDRLILTLPLRDWFPGSLLQVSFQGQTWQGRVLSSLLQADNASGPWKAEVELSLIH